MTRRIAFNYFILIAFSIVLLEVACYAMIALGSPLLSEPIRRKADIYAEQSEHIDRWLENNSQTRDIVDVDLGWRYRSGFNGSRNAINQQGLRSRKNYSATPLDGILRVAAFGDSFVYSNEVVNENAWAAIVETLFDDIEILNYGVGGFGLDQALLRYELEGEELSPDVVLIGFIADDMRRVTNVYQRFASTNAGIFTKPRFQFDEAGEMTLLPPPIRRLDDWRKVLDDPASIRSWGANDQWYEPLIYANPVYDFSALARLASTAWIRFANRYLDPDRVFIGDQFNQDSEAYRLQMRIFERFAARVEQSGARPLILILPSRGELTAALNGSENVYAMLKKSLNDLGIEHIDATEAFLSAPDRSNINAWFAPNGHYSPEGNRIVASWLGPELRALDISTYR